MTLRSERMVHTHAPTAEVAEMPENWQANISEQNYLNWAEQVKAGSYCEEG